MIICSHACLDLSMRVFVERNNQRPSSLPFNLMPLSLTHTHTHRPRETQTHTQDCRRTDKEGKPVYPSWTSWPAALYCWAGHGVVGGRNLVRRRERAVPAGVEEEHKSIPSPFFSNTPPSALWPVAGQRASYVWSAIRQRMNRPASHTPQPETLFFLTTGLFTFPTKHVPNGYVFNFSISFIYLLALKSNSCIPNRLE